MKYYSLFLVCLTFLVKASAYSEEELNKWCEEASQFSCTDAAYIEEHNLRGREVIVSYLASGGASFKRDHPDLYDLGVKGINAATLMSLDGTACMPWESLLRSVLGGVGAPSPIVYEAEVYGLVLRGHSAGQTLMDRFMGVAGITRKLSAMKLTD